MDRCWYKHTDHPLWYTQLSHKGWWLSYLPFPSLVWLVPCSIMAESQIMRNFSYVDFGPRSDFAEGQNVPHWDVGCTECSSQSAWCPTVCLVFNKIIQQTSNGACSLVLYCFQAGRRSFKKQTTLLSRERDFCLFLWVFKIRFAKGVSKYLICLER